MICVPFAAGITLWRNSEWTLELRSLRELRHEGYDGFLSPLFLAAIYQAVMVTKWLGETFDLWDTAYAVWAACVTCVTFSIACGLSAFRQRNLAAMICAGATLLAAGALFILGILP